MTWVLLIGVAWLSVALLVGVLIGRGIRLADRKQEATLAAQEREPNFVVDLTPPGVAEPAIAGAPGGIPAADPAPAETTTGPSTAQETRTDVAATPERVRHPLPGPRPPAARKSTSATERTAHPHDSGLI